MRALIFSILASVFTAFSCLCFRINTGKNPSRDTSAYLMFFFLAAFLSSLLISPNLSSQSFNGVIVGVGASVGFLSAMMMLLTFSALKRGPAALTFAFQNASGIFPGVLLFLLVGSDFGYSCTPLQFAGLLIVLGSLFWGAIKEAKTLPKASQSWIYYGLGCFLVQVLVLTLIQGRCLLFGCQEGGHSFFSDFTISQAEDVWFMPGQFAAAFLFMLIFFLKKSRKISGNEVLYGSLGGLGSFGSTLMLLLATKYAVAYEQTILFPLFAVASMVFCNVWATLIYGERFDLRTNLFCAIGVYMGIAR